MINLSIVHLHKTWTSNRFPLNGRDPTDEDERQQGTDVIIINRCSITPDLKKTHKDQTISQFTLKSDPCENQSNLTKMNYG